MSLDHLVDAPFANILAVMGILFLGIAALGGDKIPIPGIGTIAPKKSGRLMSGLLGAALLIGGAWSHVLHDTKQDLVERSEKDRQQDSSKNKGSQRSGVYPRDLNISGSAIAGEYHFKVLSAHLDEYGQDETTHAKTLLLSLRIREAFNSTFSGSGYFMPDGFRLVLDDTVASPKDCPIQIIAKGTIEDGTVTFVVPENTQRVILRVGYYDGQKSDIPLPLFSK